MGLHGTNIGYSFTDDVSYYVLLVKGKKVSQYVVAFTARIYSF